jgi:hypothetical protein
MKNETVDVLSASFEVLQRPLGPGWVMRISGRARNLQARALPFVARVGTQRVEGMAITSAGDGFEGFLRRVPAPGERLFVGYLNADLSTSITYQPGVGPVVA